MLLVFIPTFFLYVFSVFNLLGMREDLVFNHILYLFIALSAYFVMRMVSLHFLKQNAKFFYWLFVALLIITYVIGMEAKGSRRWIDLYVFQFQPSELFKIFFIIFLANLYSKQRMFVNYAQLFLKILLYTIVPAFIIFKQPDLGSAMVFAFIFFIMTFFSDVPKRYLGYIILIFALLLPLSWNFLHDYQRNRILSFVNPQSDMSGTAYNMTQAIITSGSGQLFGKGLGLGKQSNLYFLPEFHTDFAYSALVEQFGFVGGFMIILLYLMIAIIFVRNLLLMYSYKDEQGKFKFFYTLGFFSFILFQAFVNIGMNLGVMPIAGITLPLISYGGSSLVTYFVGLALLPEVKTT